MRAAPEGSAHHTQRWHDRRDHCAGARRCLCRFDACTVRSWRRRIRLCLIAALALDRKKLAAFSALGGGFLRFPIGDRRCNRTRASVGNAGGNARPSLTNATLAASRLLHRRSPTAPCSKGALAARRKKLAAFSALGGGFLHDFSLFFVAQRRNGDARER